MFSSCYRLVSDILPLYSFNSTIVESTIESYRLLQDNWQTLAKQHRKIFIVLRSRKVFHTLDLQFLLNIYLGSLNI